MNEFKKLSIANAARQQEWDPTNKVTLAYRGNEFAGEAGEVCNVLKKLERERLGIRGSRSTKEQLADELADAVICASLIANDLGIDLWAAVCAKFNKTSEAVGLMTTLERAKPRCPFDSHAADCECGGAGAQVAQVREALAHARRVIHDHVALDVDRYDAALAGTSGDWLAEHDAKTRAAAFGAAAETVRRFLSFASQRAVSWHEVNDCVDALASLAAQGRDGRATP